MGATGDVVDEWAGVTAPPPPEPVPVKLDVKSTALLILYIQISNCNLETRPRCVASLPRIHTLMAQARSRGMAVVYSLTRSADVGDIREELTPLPDEPVVRSGVDKFFGTDLETILKDRGIQTVIVTGTAAHGAVLHTATGAALREFRVIVPVDAISAREMYAEQYTAWHLANAPGTRRQTTLTRASLIEMA